MLLRGTLRAGWVGRPNQLHCPTGKPGYLSARLTNTAQLERCTTEERRAMQAGDVSSARILIVDDQPDNLRLLTFMLRRQGYRQITTTTDPCDVVMLFHTFEPDLILL